MSWADDPELVATFRAEVEERLRSLCDGLLTLESHPAPRQAVVALFRDAHTVKVCRWCNYRRVFVNAVLVEGKLPEGDGQP